MAATRVLHLISGGDVGGAKTHVLSLLSGLKDHVDIRLAVFREGPFAEEARALGIPVVVIQDGGLRESLHALEALLREHPVDLLHSHGSRGNMMSVLLSRRTGLPTVTTVHSDYRHDYKGRPLARLSFGQINRWALRKMHAYIGVSDTMTDILIDRGFAPRRLFTLYNGVVFPPQPPNETDAPVDTAPGTGRAAYWTQKGFPVPDDAILIGIAARLFAVKDVATLLRAFAIARKDNPRLRLVIAGEGPLREKLEAQADALSIRDALFFAGWLSDMGEFYRQIDINVLTSLTETFPYAILEGVRENVVTVSTRVGGIPALIDDGVNGYLIDPGDAETLATRLVALGADAELRQTLARRLYSKACDKFSTAQMFKTQIEIYETILRRARRKRDKRDEVLICGAYGRGNTGDDAILESILKEIYEVDPDVPVTVLSRRPRRTRCTHHVNAIYGFYPWKFWRAARRARLLISGGGNLIQNVTSNRSLWYYLAAIAWGHKLGARVLMYGCGVGPLRGSAARSLSAKVINRHVEAVTLRDESSYKDLQTLGVTRPRCTITADPALSLEAAPDARVDSLLLGAEVFDKGPFMGFSVRAWPGFAQCAPAFAQAADYVKERYGLTPVFVPIECPADKDAALKVAQHMKTPFYTIPHGGRGSELIGLFARMRVVLAMRLHALIFASAGGVPLIGAAYDDKVTAFLRYMGQSLILPFADVSAEALKKLIDEAMKTDDKQSRMEAVGRLRALERGNVDVLREILLG